MRETVAVEVSSWGVRQPIRVSPVPEGGYDVPEAPEDDWGSWTDLLAHYPVGNNLGYCGGCETCGFTEEEIRCPECGTDAFECRIARAWMDGDLQI